jgi:glycosyltransferase involved in cell wall biosynthesis
MHDRARRPDQQRSNKRVPAEPTIIFLPVRNGGSYLREAIGSIVGQRDPDWRLVVLENASTDDTMDTVASYRDPRISVEAAERPLGICENWGRILTWLERNDGGDELITTIGHDDVLGPDFVGATRALARAHPDATLWQASFDFIDSAGAPIRPCRPVPAVETWEGLAAALCWGIRDSFGTGYVFRARDYRRVGGIPDLPSLLYADHLLFIRLARLGHKVATDAALCRYRLHPGSASNNLSRRTVNHYVEALDGFVAAWDGEFAAFAATEPGRNALACLLGRQLAIFDRRGIRDLLAPANRDRLERLRARFAALSPGVSPAAWAGTRDAGWYRRLREAAGIASFVRVRMRERLGR